MSDEHDSVGFVIDLKTETVTFDGGFVCPIVNVLTEEGDDIMPGQDEDPVFVVVKVPPENRLVTVDLRDLDHTQVYPSFH